MAKNVGVVEIQFDRSNGEQIMYQYLDREIFNSYNISGTITEDGIPVEGIRVQISSVIGAATEAITDENGNFSLDVYGPTVLLTIGYESTENSGLLEPVMIYQVNDVASNITDLNIEINDN